MIRNMRMLRELRYGPAPRVAIGKADQVDIANQQVNTRETAFVRVVLGFDWNDLG
jgi:hypothetical protein